MKTFVSLFLSLCFIMTTSCSSVKTASFNQFSYQKTVETKLQSKNLTLKANTPYQENLKEINTLLNNLSFMLEYEKNRLHNELSYSMWKIMSDKDKNLLVGFLNYWKQKQQLSPTFIQEAHNQIQEAFDLLIQYEIKKDKQTKENILNFINTH